MLITNIYNMADTFFVSQIGTSASGAVGVIFSAMAIIQAVLLHDRHGAGTHVSQALGAGNREKGRCLRLPRRSSPHSSQALFWRFSA